MPELPEIEAMRQNLLPLISKTLRLRLKICSEKPPRKFLTAEQIQDLDDNYQVEDVIRKGKLLCMVLKYAETKKNSNTKGKDPTTNVYVFLHMGMTGRLSSKGSIPVLESLRSDEEYPPTHTHLMLYTTDTSGSVEVEICYSDPRKFGSVELSSSLEDGFGELATDGLSAVMDEEAIIAGLTEQSTPIKGILLDQRRVVSGVGNWVADDVLYHCQLHPDQTYLTLDESRALVKSLHYILSTAVQCLHDNKEFPEAWLFHRRWSRKRQGIKDANGRLVSFLKSAGRTSAIVPSLQTKRARKKSLNKTFEGDETRDEKVNLGKEAKRTRGAKRKAQDS